MEYYHPMKNSNGKNNLNIDQQKKINTSNVPITYKKKMDILVYFKQYFKEPKNKNTEISADINNTKTIYVQKWLRTKHAIFFKLSDGTVQTNFFDHHKVIIWDLGHALTYINDQKEKFHYSMKEVFEENGEKILSRIKYVNDMIEYLLEISCVNNVDSSLLPSAKTTKNNLLKTSKLQILKC